MNQYNKIMEKNYRIRKKVYNDGTIRYLPEVKNSKSLIVRSIQHDNKEWINIGYGKQDGFDENGDAYFMNEDSARNIINNHKEILLKLKNKIKVVNEEIIEIK
jgi:hypothetical protein